MSAKQRQDLRLARCVRVGLALGLMAAAPLAFAQKMYKCSDGKGGTTFQQSPCPETAREAEARQKEKERLEAEAARKKEDEARKKQEQLEKARERDKAYQEQLKQRELERQKAQEAERKIMEGAKQGQGPVPGSGSKDDDAMLPPHVAQTYPGPWRTETHMVISSALARKNVAGCSPYRYRQRAGGGSGEFIVNCTTAGAKRDHYFVWPKTEAVKGPVRF